MRDYVVIGGINSADFDIYVANKNQFDAPSRDVDIVNVPGMNGTLCLDNGRFNNQPLTYLLYIRKNLVPNIQAFRANLMDSSGYKRVQDTFNPEEYYLARFTEDFSVETSDRYRAAFTITMDRKPQRYLISGESPIEVTTGSIIVNPTRFEAKPVIRAYGTGTVAINDISIRVDSADGYTDIDSEIQEAYKGSVNCNNNITLLDGDFPVLSPKENAISFSGFSSVQITPNWFTI